MSAKVTKNFKALVPLLVKKSYKSLENNLSLGDAKKKQISFFVSKYHFGQMLLKKYFIYII